MSLLHHGRPTEPGAPDGCRSRPDLIDEAEERTLISGIEPLPFKAFQFHGLEGKRRVVSFGRRHDFSEVKLHEAEVVGRARR